MSLGTGIFLSSLFLGLILLIWITKDRVRWSRVVLWLLGAIAMIGGAGYLYSTYEPPPTKQLEYADLRLGMSQSEVAYVKGQPTNVLVEDIAERPGWLRNIAANEIGEGKTISDFHDWSYDMSGLRDARLDVSFDADKKVKAITCYSKGYSDCPSVLGLFDGSTEEKAIARLGPPTVATLDGAVKKMIYQAYNVTLWLSRRQIYMIRVSDSSDG